MKRYAAFAFALCLLLCSCTDGAKITTAPGTETGIETEAAVTADTSVFSDAAGFEYVYDEKLDAAWVTAEGAEGFFVRILVYSPEKLSVRVICEGCDSFGCGGKTYAVNGGDVFAGDDMIAALRTVAAGGACTVGDREITEHERELLDRTLKLYDAAYGAPYVIDKKTAGVGVPVSVDEDGSAVYDGETYTIKFPSVFKAELDGGVLTVYSGSYNLRAASVKYTETQFSPGIADQSSVEKTVAALGGTVVSGVSETKIGGRSAYEYCYEKDGIYITQIYVQSDHGTYILTGASYDKDDAIPKNILSTLRLK